MSGISGIFRFDGQPAAEGEIARIMAATPYRGIDGASIWTRKNVALGFQATHVTPESFSDRQPLGAANDSFVLVADARIDNRDELAHKLGIGAADSANLPDSVFILRAYQKWGAGCPEHLLGDFAFAIWDDVDGRIFCARDHMGVKPFYYSLQNGREFAFSSTLPGLLSYDPGLRSINKGMVAHFLVSTASYVTDQTYYEKIYRLPARSAMIVEADSVRTWEYWAPDLSKETRHDSDEEYAEEFFLLFKEAVRIRTRSSFSVGSTLSGGLDSSAVAAMTHLLNTEGGRKDKVFSYSAIFPTLTGSELKLIDEREYVEAVHETGAYEARFVRADLMSPMDSVEDIVAGYGQLYFGPNFYLHLGMFKQASADGVRVLLNGLDGDTVVSHGWESLSAMIHSNAWDEFDREVERLSSQYGVQPMRYIEHFVYQYLQTLAGEGKWGAFWKVARKVSGRHSIPLRWIVFNQGIKPSLPPSMRRFWNNARSHGPEEQDYLNPDFIKRAMRSGYSPYREPGDIRSPRESHWSGIKSAIWQSVLELDDAVGAVYQVEPRSPFFDKRLIEYCISLPAEQKLHDGWGRYVFRNAMQDVLPDKVRWRITKSNVSPNFNRKFIEFEADRIERILFRESDYIDEFMDVNLLRAAFVRYKEKPTGSAPEAAALYTAAMLFLWVKHVDSARAPRSRPEAGVTHCDP